MSDKEWWRRPNADALQRIRERTGLSTATLDEMTFAGWSTARWDELPGRLHARRFPLLLFGNQQTHGICPQCLHEDEHPYIRLSWLAGWCGVCAKHQAILTTFCPACLAALRGPSATTTVVSDVGRCRCCGLSLGSGLCEPAHPAAVRLQTALLRIKRHGAGTLARFDRLDWATAMALIDILLHLVWDKTLGQDIEELVARIADDYALDADARAFTPWAHNYGSLLILAWLLDGLDDRLPFVIDTLQTRPLGQLIRWVPGTSPDQRERLRIILAPGLTKRPRIQKPWQCWLETLPTATELLARAETAPRRHARERLQTFAAIRDGSSLHAAGNKLGRSPKRIRDWLDEGARVGLEAMLVPPRQPKSRPDAPTDIAAITAWLASVYRPSWGFDLWTVDRLTAGVKRKLGVSLSPAGARAIIAAEHVRRRPEFYRRLAWRGRGRR